MVALPRRPPAISAPSSPSGSGSSPAGSEHRSWAWRAPWWPARIGVVGQEVPRSVSEVVPGL